MKTYSIKEAVEVLNNIMEKHSVGRLLVVHGKASYKACGGNELIGLLYDKHNMVVDNFSEYSSDPKKEDVIKGCSYANAFMPDAILAIGGGSTIDVAKLIRRGQEAQRMPLIAIPTTGGTGTEVTQFAVCYENGIKQSVDFVDMLPDYAILIPELTMKNNQYLTACTGFDAFAQAIEAYWNINATEESDTLALQAIKLLFPALPQLKGNLEWRTDLMKGANYAGQAINITRTTAPHALSYTLTSKYGYPHGHAVALTFPFFFEKNIECPQKEYKGENYERYCSKMQNLLAIMNIDGKCNLFQYMNDYVNGIGLGFDISRPFDEIELINGINLYRAQNNPRILTIQLIKEAVDSIKK